MGQPGSRFAEKIRKGGKSNPELPDQTGLKNLKIERILNIAKAGVHARNELRIRHSSSTWPTKIGRSVRCAL